MSITLCDVCQCLLLILPGVLSNTLYEDSHFGFKIPGVEKANQLLRTEDDSFGCPVEANKKCKRNALYREFDGTCNNLKNPFWGSAGITYRRFLPAVYDDVLSLCKANALPTARRIVAALNSLPSKNASEVTVMNMQWGQFISHDINLTPSVSELPCCVNCSSTVVESSDCLAIDVRDDPFYQQFGIDCLENRRSAPAGSFCSRGREQVNGITAYIDASLVYGVTKEAADELRTFSNGQLMVRRGEEDLQGQSCPATAACPFHFLPTLLNGGQEILVAGDFRVNQHPSLTSMHTLFVRVHNDIANRLSAKYSNFNDEKLFQEARQIVIALIQHITFNEYLPSVLPFWGIDHWVLRPLPAGYLRSYNKLLDASLRNVFSAAAFRFGHSLIPDIFTLSNGKYIDLSRSFLNHTFTFNPRTHPSSFLNGIVIQKSSEVDQNIVGSVSNKLFARAPDFEHGSDLYSTNILRGRDHGLPSYMQWRRFCNLSTFRCFEDLQTIMKDGVAQVFKELYVSVDDIDLYPAAISEKPDSDGIVGPTLTCLLGEQFSRLKFGDRFYYENRKQRNYFTSDQLNSIRRTTLGALLCRYTNTNDVPQYVMRILSQSNELRNCKKVLESTVLTQLEDLF